MTTATNWLLNWAIAYSTPYLVNYGPGDANLQAKIFFIWFACCFLCIAFVYFMIYETKGLTLEQVDELYAEVKDARKSPGWQPTTSFREIRASIAAQGGQHHKGSIDGIGDRNVEKVEDNGVVTGDGYHAENAGGVDHATERV
jgi:MFS transporter, SP family, sugar:H+ symporter